MMLWLLLLLLLCRLLLMLLLLLKRLLMIISLALAALFVQPLDMCPYCLHLQTNVTGNFVVVRVVNTTIKFKNCIVEVLV